MPPDAKRKRGLGCDDCGGWEDDCPTWSQGAGNPGRINNIVENLRPTQQATEQKAWTDGGRLEPQAPPGTHGSVKSEASRHQPPFYPSAAPTHQNPGTNPAPPAPWTASAEAHQGLYYMVAGLDVTVLRDLVTRLVSSDAQLAQAVMEAWTYQIASRQFAPQPTRQQPTRPAIPLSQMQPVLDFDHVSKRAWRALNNGSLLSMSGSRQSDVSGDVHDEICECIGTIDEETKTESPFGTKLSALETLRKIAKTVILGEDTVGHEVRKELQCDSDIADVMIRVLESMMPEERIRAGKNADSKGTLISKVEWVQAEAEAYALEGFNGLDKVLQMMGTGSSAPETTQGSSSAPIDLTS